MPTITAEPLTHPTVFLENRAREVLLQSRPTWWKREEPLTQVAVAERCGLEASGLTKVLNYEGAVDIGRKGGGPSLRALVLIAWALEKPFSELYSFEVEPVAEGKP